MDRPKLRPVEAFPVEHGEQTLICLRDPSGIAPEPIVVGMGAYFLITLFTGGHSLLDIQAAFVRRFGDILPSERLRELVASLDAAGFLDSPTHAERLRKAREEFERAPARAAALMGRCYESEPGRLRAEIEAYVDSPSGPGRNGRESNRPLAGLVAPHIDPRRGGPVYAHAYCELTRHPRPEIVVILGTSHHGGGPELFTATRKDYATPLGTVPTDRDLLERIASRYRAGDLFAEEMLHRREHSTEFQALFLAWALGTGGYRIVPILVGPFHEMAVGGTRPADDPRVRSFLDALLAELGAERRRVLILSGVDFAHLGRKFGDDFSVDERVAETMRREDGNLIENVRRGDPDAFFGHIAREHDRRRICGLAPIYTQLELLRGHAGRLLAYDIALEPETGSAVSFAGLAID